MAANIDDNDHIETWLARSLDKENVSPVTEPPKEMLPNWESGDVSNLQSQRSQHCPSVVSIHNVEKVDPACHDRVYILPKVAEDKKLTLMHSKHAGGDVPKLVGLSPKTQSGSNLLDQDRTSRPMTPTQRELLAKTQSRGSTASYDRSVNGVQNIFEAQPALVSLDGRVNSVQEGSRIADNVNGQRIRSDGFPDSFNTISEPPLTQESTHTLTTTSENSSSTTMSPLPAQIKRVASTSSSIATPTKVAAYDSLGRDSADKEAALKEANNVLVSKLAETKLISKDDTKYGVASETTGGGIDREHTQFFDSWGEPAARMKPRSRIRKIVLRKLPVGSDLTLAQALIHGGAIDEMSIDPSGTVAYVTFTTADACDAYYSKYPNGIIIKHKGRDHAVFVDKGQDVDVVSGMLEAYLDAGASRVVRAVNADTEWTMRALHRIAEGAKGKRKVESITDTFRNEVRTIVFRFANVHDAVTFRGLLRRDSDWEFADISFMVDPCELATGVHYD